MIRVNKYFRLAFLLASLLLANSVSLHAQEIQALRVWASPESTRVVLDLSDSDAHYKMFTLENPHRVVIDIQAQRFTAKFSPTQLVNTGITNIRHSPSQQGKIRIVFDVQAAVKPSSFVLAPNQTYGHRLVIDLNATQTPLSLPVSKPLLSEQAISARKWIIAIDAGHGGEDSGAVGKHRRLREKEVVLAVAKKLQALINAQKGMEAFLIRSGDYYVSLRKRTALAREKGADLFISVHADSFHNVRASGASVFVLSEKGASSEAARWLAERENRADLIGGVSLEDKSNVLASVLLDLSQTASQGASQELASQLLQQLGKVTDLHHKNVQRAGFMVLKSPDIPSVLVELGFISNKIGEEKLQNPHHQQLLAQALLAGVKNYTAKRALPVSLDWTVAKKREIKKKQT